MLRDDIPAIVRLKFEHGCIRSSPLLRCADVEYLLTMKAFLAVIFLLAASTVSYAQPSVYFEKLENDLGTINQREDRVEHVLEFENRGDKDLIIWSLVPS